MLNNDKIHPKLAFEHSGMFVDPEIAFRMSEEYRQKNIQDEVNELDNLARQDINAEKNVIDNV